MNNKPEEHFQSAKDMMDNIRAVKGAPFARTVECALNTLKLRDVFQITLSAAQENIGEEDAERMMLVVGKIMASQIALCGINGGLSTASAESAAELMTWANKIYNAEQDGAKAFLEGED